jgi:hypothetical protein
MTDEPFYSSTAKPAPPRVAKPGELLFEFHLERTHRFYRVELRDHGPVYGVEAQFLDPIDPILCRTFRPDLDPTRTPREMAITWAEEERKAMEKGGQHG